MSADSLSTFFDDDLLNRLNAPTAEGSALPNAAYMNPEFYALENERLFRGTWCFAGFAHDIPDPGDVSPVSIAGRPVLLIRGEDHRIRAFHNVCSHRGAQLIAEPGSGLKNIVCPNHSWTYRLDGRLKARPHFFGGKKHDNVDQPRHRADLKEIACDTWFDWVFVNLSGNATPLTDYTGVIRERLGEYDLNSLEFCEAMQFDVNANWKLPIENFIEPYHVFSCHRWLNSFVSMQERHPPEFEEQVLNCGYDFKETDPARGQGLPYFPNLSECATRRGEWFVLFPNFGFQIFPDQLAVFVVTPLTIVTCRETIALYFVAEGATAKQYETARRRVLDNWRDLNHEDIGIIERMQAGRYSDGFEGGVLSPYWDPVLQHFARLVVDAVTSQD